MPGKGSTRGGRARGHPGACGGAALLCKNGKNGTTAMAVVLHSCEGTAMKSGLGTSLKSFFYYKPMSPSSARRLKLTKEGKHLAVRKKVRWYRAMPFQHFPT